MIYLRPEKNSGTIFYKNKIGDEKKEVEWKQNRAVFFSRKEKSLMYLIAFIVIYFIGPGKYSVDKE